MGGACITDAKVRNAYKVLVCKPEEKRLLTITRHKLQDRIRMLTVVLWDITSCGLVGVTIHKTAVYVFNAAKTSGLKY
jgi:hypothetical protein